MVTVTKSNLASAPAQSIESSLIPPKKSLWTHFADRISSIDGLFDALKVGEYFSHWLKMIPHLSSNKHQLSTAQGTFLAGATLASLPGLVTTIADTVASCSLLGKVVVDRTRNPTARDQDITSIAKKSGRDLLDLACMGTDTANNFHELGWVDLGKAAPVSCGIFLGTDLIGNGLDLANEVGKVSERAAEKATKQISPERTIAIHHKDNLSYMRIFKNVSSIVGSTIAIASLFVGGVIALPIVGLAFSSLWIVSKITTHFYKEIAVKSASLAYKPKI